jgi:hypothetical protein
MEEVMKGCEYCVRGEVAGRRVRGWIAVSGEGEGCWERVIAVSGERVRGGLLCQVEGEGWIAVSGERVRGGLLCQGRG